MFDPSIDNTAAGMMTSGNCESDNTAALIYTSNGNDGQNS
ncbi:unnamed protein product, partial [Rotaria sordida]